MAVAVAVLHAGGQAQAPAGTRDYPFQPVPFTAVKLTDEFWAPRIEINRNKFVLIDQSTNGTFVQAEGGEELFVRRDSVQIKGEGLIGLGRVPERDSPLTIRFYCEEQ